MLAGLGAVNTQSNHASANTAQPTASHISNNSNHTTIQSNNSNNIKAQATNLHNFIHNNVTKIANNNYRNHINNDYSINDLLNNKGYSDENNTVTSDHLDLSNPNINKNERHVVANNGNWYGEFSDDYGGRYGQLKGYS